MIGPELKYIKGIGERRATLLRRELDIADAHDLVMHLPNSYVDRTGFYNISSFRGDMPSVQVRGRFLSFSVMGEGARLRLVGMFTDGHGVMDVVWFRKARELRNAYHPGVEYVIFGKPVEFQGHWSMTHPEVDIIPAEGVEPGLRGIYPLTEKLRQNGIASRQIGQWIRNALPTVLPHVRETLPAALMQRLGLVDKVTALRDVHFPASQSSLERARLRLKFEELFFLQLSYVSMARARKLQLQGYRFPRIGQFFNSFYTQCLPFELTNAQKKVVREIHADTVTGRQMNRLVQGDVGSGKTLVALMAMLIALDNGTQACLMAPTEILATQHYETISKLVAPIGVNVKLLTGSTPTRQRNLIHQQLRDGELHILIGTHAVVENPVQFNKLGLAVIDEQHRFGVAQRARLWRKGTIAPHILVMTATPIPRTLAMTVYGDLDISVIDELPPGRKPVKTLLRYDEKRMEMYYGIGRQLREGRQVYIVYPMIKESEKSDLHSVEQGYEYIRELFHNYTVAMVHGKMRSDEKEHQMNLFVSGKAAILVATTVIEVGVNVPNATTMVIENAERFGLSQLHQLRGRVGRGADQSYCILMTKRKIAADTRKRLNIMTTTTDGFVVAEADLSMRGPGDLEGTVQSGLPVKLRVANLATDGQIVSMARNAAVELLDADPDLTAPEHAATRAELYRLRTLNTDWSRIS